MIKNNKNLNSFSLDNSSESENNNSYKNSLINVRPLTDEDSLNSTKRYNEIIDVLPSTTSVKNSTT